MHINNTHAGHPLGGLLAWALPAVSLAATFTVTEVPPLAPPDNTQPWTLQSSCVDINDNGWAACRSVAIGPPYRCGWRGSQTCHDVVARALRWDGSQATPVSPVAGPQEVPLGINGAGDVYGHVYQGQTYGPNAGRIWRADGSVRVTEGIVLWLNDRGQYVDETAMVVGGSTMVYNDVAHEADGSVMPVFGVGGGGFTGTGVHAISPSGRLVGGQIIQAAVFDGTGDIVPEVSGVGWFIDQARFDSLPRNEDGTLDVYGPELWPDSYARPMGGLNQRTFVADVNDRDEIIVMQGMASVGYGSLRATLCKPKGKTPYHAPNGKTYYGKYTCTGGWQGGTTGLRGLNNRGDLVGDHYPNGLPPAVPMWWTRQTKPWQLNTGVDLNAALAGSGYQVITAYDINDQGQVAATCKNALGEQRGCIVTVR